MPSQDREKFSKLDQLSEKVEDDVATGNVATNCSKRDTTRAQDMVDQLCEKITQKVPVEAKKKKHIPWKIYASRAMTAWGDRLWSFGAGIFMNLLAPENLRLVAIYGFATSVSVIFFGAGP